MPRDKRKARSYLLSGIILTYFGLKDMDDFLLYYNGVALAFGVAAFILSLREMMKSDAEEE